VIIELLPEVLRQILKFSLSGHLLNPDSARRAVVKCLYPFLVVMSFPRKQMYSSAGMFLSAQIVDLSITKQFQS
jgi:hypothetical protein